MSSPTQPIQSQPSPFYPLFKHQKPKKQGIKPVDDVSLVLVEERNQIFAAKKKKQRGTRFLAQRQAPPAGRSSAWWTVCGNERAQHGVPERAGDAAAEAEWRLGPPDGLRHQ